MPKYPGFAALPTSAVANERFLIIHIVLMILMIHIALIIWKAQPVSYLLAGENSLAVSCVLCFLIV